MTGEKAPKCEVKHDEDKRFDSRSLSPQLLAPVAFLLHSVPMTIERLVRSQGNNKMMINVKSWAVTVGALNPALELHSLSYCTLSDQQSIHGRSTHSDVI